MTERFRLALVGAGMIAGHSHLPAALASPNVQVVAIVDPARERARSLAQAYGVRAVIAADVREVLDEIDGAIIATPNYTHRSIAVACLEAGVATLIEKPLAGSYADGEAIVLAGAKSGRPVAVGYCTRFRDNTLLLKELLDSGHFGTVRRFAHQFGTRGGWAPVSGYNLERQASGGGVLVVSGTHFLDRMLYLWGYPDDMNLEDDRQGGPEANCVAAFRYGRGADSFEGCARYSKTVQLPGGLVIETDRGIVSLADYDRAEISFRPRSTPNVEHVVRSLGAPPYRADMPVFQRQLSDFVDACRTGRPPRVDGRQGLQSLRLIEDLRARRSAMHTDWYRAVAGGR